MRGHWPPEHAGGEIDIGNQVAVRSMTRGAAFAVGALAVEQVLGGLVLGPGAGGGPRREEGADEREAGKKVTHRWQ